MSESRTRSLSVGEIESSSEAEHEMLTVDSSRKKRKISDRSEQETTQAPNLQKDFVDLTKNKAEQENNKSPSDSVRFF